MVVANRSGVTGGSTCGRCRSASTSTGRRIFDGTGSGEPTSPAAGKCPLLHHAVGSAKEATMLAIVAAVLFLIALIFELASVALGPLDALFFITAGLLCLALQFAGVGRSRI